MDADFQDERSTTDQVGRSRHGSFPDGETHQTRANAEPLLQRLEEVQKSGLGWRARCPNCGGRSRKLTIVEKDCRVLLHCFSCHDSSAVLAAVGMSWGDLHPPRHWPQTPEERRNARRAIRDAGLMAAVEVLADEAVVIEAAGRRLQQWQYLSVEDDERLSLAVERAGNARATLAAAQPWRARS